MTPSEIEIEIARSGTPTAPQIDDARLREIAAAYSAANPAPLAIGEVQDDSPAHGWIAGLRVDGKRLLAKARDVSSELITALQAGKVERRRVALWSPGHGSNPTPGRWNLRHVAFIGSGLSSGSPLAFSAEIVGPGIGPARAFNPADYGLAAYTPYDAGARRLLASAQVLQRQAEGRGRSVTFDAALDAVTGAGPWDNPAEIAFAVRLGSQACGGQ